jgi:pimeloyl-ACP methyl ester carboxylesterase
MAVIKAGAFDLDYSDTGSGPSVVLVHSSASGNRQWRRLTDELRDRYRLIAVNLFGYGATTPWHSARPQTLADQAELVLAAASIADKPVALVGHSMGGAVTLEAALRLGERLRIVIVFEPILFYLLKQNGETEAFAEIEAIADSFRAHGLRDDWERVGEMFVDYWSGPGNWAALSAERKAGLIAMLPNVVHDWDSTIPGGRPLADWDRIAAPVHVIQAADTRLSTRRVTAVLASSLKHWQFHMVPAGGHMAPLARLDLVNPLIAEILDGTRP